MNVFDQLIQDHNRARDIIKQLMSTESRHKLTRIDLFNELKRELVAHSHAEEKLFYPKLVDQKPTHDLIEEGINDHHTVEKLLDRISSLSVESDDFLNAISDLQKMVEHHVQEEENQVFPKARQLLDQNQFEPLGEQVKATEDQEKRQIH
jgi:hemerythrin superfamily protein